MHECREVRRSAAGRGGGAAGAGGGERGGGGGGGGESQWKAACGGARLQKYPRLVIFALARLFSVLDQR